jgi:hypothetical protein
MILRIHARVPHPASVRAPVSGTCQAVNREHDDVVLTDLADTAAVLTGTPALT